LICQRAHPKTQCARLPKTVALWNSQALGLRKS